MTYVVETHNDITFTIDKSVRRDVAIVVIHSLRRKRLTGLTVFAYVY